MKSSPKTLRSSLAVAMLLFAGLSFIQIPTAKAEMATNAQVAPTVKTIFSHCSMVFGCSEAQLKKEVAKGDLTIQQVGKKTYVVTFAYPVSANGINYRASEPIVMTLDDF